MQKVDEDPVFGQLVAVTPIHIDDPHIAWPVACRHAHESAGGRQRQVRPAEKAAKGSFRDAADMAVENTVLEPGTERSGMLVGITLDGVGGADPGRPPPDHVLVPAAAQFLGQRFRAPAFPVLDVGHHIFDGRKRSPAFLCRLGIEHDTVMRRRAGLHEVRPCLRREGGQAGLHHQMRYVEIHRRLGDPAAVHPMKLGIAKHGDLAGWRDSEPCRVEQPHEMAHRGDPDTLVPLDPIVAGEKDVEPALQRRQRGVEWRPETIGDRIGAVKFVERVKAMPEIVV